MSSLLIVEDDAAIRTTLVDWFQGRGTHVVAVDSAERAHELLLERRFAAVLLDLRLPGQDGLELLRDLRRRGDATPVIVTTARGEEEQRIRGLELGADDYVVKPFSVRELEARIAAVVRRAGAVPTRVQLGACEVDLEAHEVRRGDASVKLVAKEAQLLGWLLLHAGKTHSRRELLRAVWGHDALPTTRTVDTHVFNLRRKIEVDPERPEHLLTVHGVGYRLVR